MAAPALSWDDLWASFTQMSAKSKQELLDQIDLKCLIKGLSQKEAIKVLRCAPIEIQRPYQNILNKPVAIRAQRRMSPKQISRFVIH